MESVVEAPMYVSCMCNDCGHKWESEAWTKDCPECNGNNVSQSAMIRGL